MPERKDFQIEDLRSGIPIVGPGGLPTPDFLRRWSDLSDTLTRTTEQQETETRNVQTAVQQVQRQTTQSGATVQILWVNTAADLAPYLDGDRYVLPARLIVPTTTIDLGDKALEMSTDTVINGLSKGVFMSSNPNGVLRATVDVASAVIVHNVSFVATVGPVLAMTGPIDQQLNLDFVGLFGPTAGTITGYDVSSLKSCFIQAGDGVTYEGTTNKIFVHGCPFYAITGAAVRFSATLVCGVVYIESTFFKFDAPGKGIEALAGYSVERGLILSSLKQGTLDMFVGLDPADIQWDMKNNQGIRDSSVIGAFVQDVGEQTTVIAAVNTPVKANLTTTDSLFNERFSSENNRLTYIGLDPVTVLIMGSTSMGSASPNQDARMWAALNDTPLLTARMRAELRGGGDTDPVTLSGITRLETGDYLELWVENTTSDANLTLEDSSMTIGQTS